MFTTSRSLAGLSAALAALCAPGGALAQNLVQNGGFEFTNNPFIPGLNGDKMLCYNAVPTGWTSGFDLTILGAPGTADDPLKILPVYAPFPTSSGPGISGGNFVEQDGDPGFRTPISQMLTIPAAGTYQVSFLQAAGQQQGYNGATTERWQVTLGSAGTQLSPLMSVSSHGMVPWQPVSLTFNVASSGSYLLELVALGVPAGVPPVAFIDNVGVNAVPGPASLAVIGIGLLGSVARGRLRRGKSPEA